MNVAEYLHILHHEVLTRAYINRVDILEQTVGLVKARLYLSFNLFVQVYRNDQFDTTNLVLVYNGRRVYARDQLNGKWHRHTVASPQAHDYSPEGCHSVTLTEFLDEIEDILAALGLP